MINRRSCSVSRSLRFLIVAIAICVAPLGLVDAQDFEAVERRLGGAIEAGELTLEQAGRMMEALRRNSKGNRDQEAARRKFVELAHELEMAVKQGQITKQDAQKKMTAIRREMSENRFVSNREDLGESDKKRRYMELVQEIEMAVKEGIISKQDAKKKLIAVRREMFEQQVEQNLDDKAEADKKHRFEEVARKIELAVKAGELSEQEAEKKLAAVKRELFGEHLKQGTERRKQAENRRRFAAQTEEIKRAVKAGKISEEDAKRKIVALQQEREAVQQQLARGSDEKAARKMQYVEAARAVEMALSKGNISAVEAKQKIEEARRELLDVPKTKDRKKDKLEHRKHRYEEIAREIEKALKEGKISKADAKEKFTKLREELEDAESDRDR